MSTLSTFHAKATKLHLILGVGALLLILLSIWDTLHEQYAYAAVFFASAVLLGVAADYCREIKKWLD